MAKLNIDTDYIAKLAELLQRTGLTEIEISEGDAKVRVAKKVPRVVEVEAVPSTTAAVARPAPVAAAAAAPEEPARAPDATHPGAVKSPMVGTVYLAAEPGSPSFVSVGDTVSEGQTLLIIEAMKVMNAIRADRAGKVTQILVENASPVEYGEALMIIE